MPITPTLITPTLTTKLCQQARLSRDPRFDGVFFTAVKTTQIYCRPICPATSPKESNVVYYASAIEAANAGYRPCLRCRPDSAPGSPAWKGVATTLERALRLINEGALQSGSLSALAERLGVSERYLRGLFAQHLGVSPKTYALYQQCLFAKQLLHQTDMPITQIALASGFKSVRRFNDCFRSNLNLSPSAVRKSKQGAKADLRLKLYFRPPYDWSYVSRFLQARAIAGLEWCDEHSYGRTFNWQQCQGYFTATYVGEDNRFDVDIFLDDLQYLNPVVNNIRRILDLDADIEAIEQCLQLQLGEALPVTNGLRLPGIWTAFEAGVRAILGQQISVAAAHRLVSILVERLGDVVGEQRFFPSAEAIAQSNLEFFKMPGARKQTLKEFAAYHLANPKAPPDEWIAIKGIGPWTINYARFRGLSDPDIYLAGDLGVKKAASLLPEDFDPEAVAPWRSYLTLYLWQQL